MRQLVWLWNLRISYPQEETLQLADDVSAAFHRILYDPLMALVFATVWGMHLVTPVGTIFGAQNSPSFYMEAGETRSHLAGSWPDATSLPLQDLAEQVVLPPSPTPAEAAAFAQAVADSQHQGIEITPLCTFKEAVPEDIRWLFQTLSEDCLHWSLFRQ